MSLDIQLRNFSKRLGAAVKQLAADIDCRLRKDQLGQSGGVASLGDDGRLAQAVSVDRVDGLSAVGKSGLYDDLKSRPFALAAITVYSVVAQEVTAYDIYVIRGQKRAPLQGSPVVFSTTGTLPSPLVAGKTYYVLSCDPDAGYSPTPATDFKVSTDRNGPPIKITEGSGSGTHTIANPIWRKSDNTPRLVEIEVQGAGGSGGSGGWTTSGAATGGSAGGYVWALRRAEDLPDTATITVGEAKTPPRTAGTNGEPGGSSSFGTSMSAMGGYGGLASATCARLTAVPPTSSTGVGGDIYVPGQGALPVLDGTTANYTSGGASRFGPGGLGYWAGGGSYITPRASASGRGAGGAGGNYGGDAYKAGAGYGGDGLVVVKEYK